MHRRTMLQGTALTAALARPALGQGAGKTMRFVPYVNLTNLDPVWTVTGATMQHGFMVYDMLYGIDANFVPHPQMCAGHELSSDRLTWLFTLRDGLRFHDGEPVRAVDCTTSIQRWMVKDPFGQAIAAILDEMQPLDDKRFHIRVKKPFPQMLFALGSRPCFIMPERMARVPASEQIKEAVGSGPFRFVPGEWVSGARAVWTKFEGYVPRQEAPSTFAGAKIAHIDRVEWVVQPDPATAAAALRTGEVDWIEWPLTDLLPQLKQSKGVTVKAINWPHFCVLAFNHLYPPFDNPKLRRALLPAIDQKAFIQAIVGDQMELSRLPAGYYTEGTPMANKAGMEALTGPRDLALARRLVAESGYKGEPILMMSPTDSPPFAQLAHMVRGLMMELGMNVDFREMDFGSIMARRVNQAAPAAGGRNCFSQIWTVLNSSNPGNCLALRANGKGAAFGWPTDAGLEALRQQWFDAPDPAAQFAVAERIQQRAFEVVPGIPLGQVVMPTAFRDNVTDVARTPYPVFWGVKKG